MYSVIFKEQTLEYLVFLKEVTPPQELPGDDTSKNYKVNGFLLNPFTFRNISTEPWPPVNTPKPVVNHYKWLDISSYVTKSLLMLTWTRICWFYRRNKTSLQEPH